MTKIVKGSQAGDIDGNNDIDLEFEGEAHHLLPLLKESSRNKDNSRRLCFGEKSSIVTTLRRKWLLLILAFVISAIFLFNLGILHDGQKLMQYFGSIDTKLDILAKEQAHARLSYLQETIGRDHLVNNVVIKDLEADYGLQAYSARLDRIYNDYFAPRGRYASRKGPYAGMWKQIEKHLNVASSYNNRSRIPPRISSSIRNTSQVPEAFNKWKTSNPEWQINLYNDTDMEVYLQMHFASMGRVSHTARDDTSINQTFIDKWHNLPISILRVDTFRYLNIFLQGGVYSDSDTGGLYSVEQWPGLTRPHAKVLDKTDDSLQFIEALPLLNDDNKHKETQLNDSLWSADRPLKNDSVPSNPFWTPPSLAIAIEYDAPGGHKKWKDEKLARPLQITQFAFLAEPFHPVLLDCLGSIMDTAAKYKDTSLPSKGDEYMQLILDWTGPGIFTDAVYRYLIARYGFDPFHLASLGDKAARIGDVLVYPEFAYGIDQWHHLSKDFELIYHGFMHRWIDNDHHE